MLDGSRPTPNRGPVRTYMITRGNDESLLCTGIARSLALGTDLVQLRLVDTPGREVERIVTRVLDRFDAARSRLLVNDRLDIALGAGAGGVHLRSSSLATDRVRALAPEGFLIARSVHGAKEAVAAANGGADFVVFGPVFQTGSKPGHPGAGIDALRAVAASVDVDVFALGGMTAERVFDVARAGAAGLAGISVFETEASRRALQRSLAAWREGAERP